MGERGVTGVELLVALALAGILAAAVAWSGPEKININRPPVALDMPHLPAK
jgi:prepilin-type N-terminal cleavage/methylation domain-containing protein